MLAYHDLGCAVGKARSTTHPKEGTSWRHAIDRTSLSVLFGCVVAARSLSSGLHLKMTGQHTG
eukprot:4142581-Amphidinium_carterae.1